jgi:para-aminobenzoate synthetase/4-amino-4-deoxychorismate lyase
VADASKGVFETLLVRDGRIQALALHLDRLRASVGELYGLALPDGLGAEASGRAAGLSGAHRLRVDVVPSPDELAITLTTSPLDPARPRRYACIPHRLPGGQGAHKFRDRARLEPDGGVALLVDTDDTVLEAAWANVWLLDGDRLITPPTDARILPGVTRARLLELAPSLGLQATERPITLTQARAAPVMLLTSSLALAATAAVDAEPPSIRDPSVDAIRDALARGDWS